MVQRSYGWRPSLPDIRDYRFAAPVGAVPTEVDLRDSGNLPAIWDQGQLGSCTAHGAGAAYSFDLAKQGAVGNYTPSRLFVYYNTRVIEGTVNEDSGATITDVAKSINKYGAPPESDWAYNISQFTKKPPQKAFDDGLNYQAITYGRVDQTTTAMRAVLAAGFPIIVGFTVYDSFESDAVAQTGIVPMPSSSESVLGGHCVLVVGYKNINGKLYWICRNSWGTEWGDNGYFYMPQAYLTNTSLADDFWVIKQVESPGPAPVPPQPTPTPAPSPTPAPDDDPVMKFFRALYAWIKAWFS